MALTFEQEIYILSKKYAQETSAKLEVLKSHESYNVILSNQFESFLKEAEKIRAKCSKLNA